MRQTNYILRGGDSYSAPTVDMLNVCAEKGFAESNAADIAPGEGGFAGGSGPEDLGDID